MPLSTAKLIQTTVPGSVERAAVVLTNLSALLHANRCLANPGIAIGTTVQKVKTVNAVSYRIEGALFTKAATDDFWTLSGTTIPDGSTNVILLLVDAAGAASVLEGTPATTAGAVRLPALPQAKAVMGYLTIATAGATFVPGTTALNAGTATVTYTNGMPAGYFSQIADLAGTVVSV